MKLDDSVIDVYFKTYCRIPPYVMGMVLGYVIYFSKEFKLSKVKCDSNPLTILWILPKVVRFDSSIKQILSYAGKAKYNVKFDMQIN